MCYLYLCEITSSFTNIVTIGKSVFILWKIIELKYGISPSISSLQLLSYHPTDCLKKMLYSPLIIIVTYTARNGLYLHVTI